ncbi:MAG: hypothetical protein QM401_04150 [Bacillota bacterium]|nr:hypothetical protein [Bacillota bacterium]
MSGFTYVPVKSSFRQRFCRHKWSEVNRRSVRYVRICLKCAKVQEVAKVQRGLNIEK